MNQSFDRIEKVRALRPLIHHITNVVTVTDCANITLSCGAAPVMAHASEEVTDMAHLASALVLNIGTLDTAQVERMIQAGKAANKKGIPIILDPVGAGATPFRTQVAQKLLEQLHISYLKGNAGEIATLTGMEAEVRGVDSGTVKADLRLLAIQAAQKWNTLVVVTGEKDVISDGRKWAVVSNGDPLMATITGTGCMSASVLASFAAVAEEPLTAATSAMVSYGVAAEQAASSARGPASFRTGLFDALFSLDSTTIKEHAQVEWGKDK